MEDFADSGRPGDTPTRGGGLLEGYLARKRAQVAEGLIDQRHRAGRILDLGCGKIPFFLLHTDFAQKAGIERQVNPNASELADKYGIFIIEYDLSSSLNLPCRAKTFDVITMLAVLEHLPEACRLDLMKQVCRCLKPGGALIVTTPAAWLDRVLRIMAKCRLVSEMEVGEHRSACHARYLRQLLTNAGFSAERVTVGSYLFGAALYARAVRK